MTEHHHTKQLTLNEQVEAATYRTTINEVINRLHLAYEVFRRNHNSGYCAFELQHAVDDMNDLMASLNALLLDLGNIEHYNYEAVLAQYRSPEEKLQALRERRLTGAQ